MISATWSLVWWPVATLFLTLLKKLQRKVPHHHLHAGCPVVALRDVTEEKDLGMFAFGQIDANTLRALVAFNDVNLEDDEVLQVPLHCVLRT